MKDGTTLAATIPFANRENARSEGDQHQLEPRDAWMRPVSFFGLLRILRIVAGSPAGLRASELDEIIRSGGAYQTGNGRPSRTTLYPCRNTLLRLGALKREGRRVTVERFDPLVAALLNEEQIDSLSSTAKEHLATLVLRNSDCRRHFFDLFMRGSSDYTLADFRNRGRSVVWFWERPSPTGKRAVLEGSGGRSMALSFPSAIKGILYGIRYWARDQLGLIDEFFREERGFIMYPLRAFGEEEDPSRIAKQMASLAPLGNRDWVELSVSDLKVQLCEKRGQEVRSLLNAIRWLEAAYAGYVVLVPTSRAFATLTASSANREQLQLRGYFQDNQGRYISHIRLHNSVLSALKEA